MPPVASADLEVVACWPIGAIISADSPSTGAVNRTLLVRTTAGSYALRAYRHLGRTRVESEHALIAYAADHGVPAPRPLKLPNGETILERGGRFFALFPWAAGRQIVRHALGPAELA